MSEKSFADLLDKIKEMKARGLSVPEIVRNFGKSPKTAERWLKVG